MSDSVQFISYNFVEKVSKVSHRSQNQQVIFPVKNFIKSYLKADTEGFYMLWNSHLVTKSDVYKQVTLLSNIIQTALYILI